MSLCGKKSEPSSWLALGDVGNMLMMRVLMVDQGIKLVKWMEVVENNFPPSCNPPRNLWAFRQNKAITNHNTITLLPIFADSTCLIIIFASFSRLSVACKQHRSKQQHYLPLRFFPRILSHPRRKAKNQHFKLLINNCGVDFNKRKKAILSSSLIFLVLSSGVPCKWRHAK